MHSLSVYKLDGGFLNEFTVESAAIERRALHANDIAGDEELVSLLVGKDASGKEVAVFRLTQIAGYSLAAARR